MRLTVEGAATRLEGPLLFLQRTLEVGLNDAVEVRAVGVAVLQDGEELRHW